MITIKQFLTKNVEGYLFKDLNTLERVKLRKGQKIGGVGYPMIGSIIAGMELLGGLLQNKTFNPNDGTTYFNNYWDNYFSKYKSKYSQFRDSFYRLIRHGIAHTYLTKTGVFIKKGDSKNHLQISEDESNYYLEVDIGELHKDFINSYESLVKPIVWNGVNQKTINKETMQERLNEMIERYESESNTLLKKLSDNNKVLKRSIQDILQVPKYSLASGSTAMNVSGTVAKYTKK